MTSRLENVYFTEAELANSPSRLDGVDEATEAELRAFGCQVIQQAGILLKLYVFNSIIFFCPPRTCTKLP